MCKKVFHALNTVEDTRLHEDVQAYYNEVSCQQDRKVPWKNHLIPQIVH